MPFWHPICRTRKKERSFRTFKSQDFAGQKGEKLLPVKEDVEGFDQFMIRYKKGLAIEHAAVDALK